MEPNLADARALIAADQADNRIRLFNPFATGDRKPTLWSYPPEDRPAIKHMPTDAKRVEIDDEIHILAAYHGRVRLVRMRDHEVILDYPSYSSCHSAERLPDGNLVTANSNHGMLRLHRGADDFTDLKLPYAHGVAWDKQRNRLWALGDQLYRIRYAEGDLTLDIEKSFPLPRDPTGHDLFPLADEAKLLVSNNEALFLFDIATEKFETVAELKGVKSASQHLDGTIWASEPKDIEGAASWQSDSVIRVRPRRPELVYKSEGMRFYKARWWQKVSFSY